MFSLNSNLTDLIILVILLFFIHQGFVNGFWAILVDFVAFLGTLLISLKAYKLAATILHSNALGYLVVAIIIEILISFTLTFLIKKLPQKILKNHVTKLFGILLSFGQGLILITFALTFLITLPVNPSIKVAISNSKIGGFLLTKTTGIEKSINAIFSNSITNSLIYTTVEPKSHESIPLDSGSLKLSVDETSENQMVKLVDTERTNRGLAPLTVSPQLLDVARNYGKKMWQEHYFGHYDNNDKDVGNRLTLAGVYYTLAGENLALAPTVTMAILA